MLNTKYFFKEKSSWLLDKTKCKFKVDLTNKHIIIVYEKNNILGYLEFTEDLIKTIKVDKNIDAYYLISKYLIMQRNTFDKVKIAKSLFGQFREQFSLLNVLWEEEQDNVLIDNKAKYLKRLVEVGVLPTGKNNSLTDVPGVKVGHVTYLNNDHHTGLTAILPHENNCFKNKVFASCYVGNGFSKPIGFSQVEELGTLETPIILTNTLSIGIVADGLIKYMLKKNEDIGLTTGTVNPLIMECNDSGINNIRDICLTDKDVEEAIEKAQEAFLQGSVGAGTGMSCHGFKGGIGTSSRIVEIKENKYHLGVLVNSNFKGNSSDLVFNKKFVGQQIDQYQEDIKDKGSIAVVIATDIPLDNRQLKRLAKRAIIGIGNTGSYMGNGSGDLVLAFSTANRVNHYPNDEFVKINSMHDFYIDKVFQAVVEATEEAILNSLLFNHAIKGFNGKIKASINEYIEVIDDLLITKL